MRGLDEPPGGGEQQSYSQLSNSICQNIRGVTYTDSSAERPTGSHARVCHWNFACKVVFRCVEVATWVSIGVHMEEPWALISVGNETAEVTFSSAPAKTDDHNPQT